MKQGQAGRVAKWSEGICVQSYSQLSGLFRAADAPVSANSLPWTPMWEITFCSVVWTWAIARCVRRSRMRVSIGRCLCVVMVSRENNVLRMV